MAIKPLNNIGGKNLSYVGKDFETLKQNLVDFTKTYFPNSYSDFSEASPGTIFIDQAAAIGDMLSFYQDVQLKESMLAHATEKKNIVSIAQSMGYKPKVTSPAVCEVTVYQLVPDDGTGIPDDRYFLRIKDGMEIESTSNSSIIFRTTDAVDFTISASREVEVYERLNTGVPS